MGDGPSEGKLSAVKFSCRFVDAYVGVGDKKLLARVLGVGAVAAAETAPPQEGCDCAALVLMAANWRRVAPKLPLIPFFFALDLAAGAVGNVGKSSSVTLPASFFRAFSRCTVAPEDHPTNGAEDPP